MAEGKGYWQGRCELEVQRGGTHEDERIRRIRGLELGRGEEVWFWSLKKETKS